jgi:hypothetical protein
VSGVALCGGGSFLRIESESEMRVQARGSTREERKASFIISVVLVAAFGPYLSPSLGIRLEHLVIYPLAVSTAMASALRHKEGRFRYAPAYYVILLGVLLTHVLWTTMVAASSHRERSAMDLVAGIENFVQPIAIAVIVHSVARSIDDTALAGVLDRAGRTILVLLMTNSCMAFANVFTDTWPIMKFFVSGWGSTPDSTVWQRAASMGRYTGIFNQPLEAGLAYSVGALIWVYLSSVRGGISAYMWISAMSVLLGGVLSVSKTLILGGFPLAALYFVALRKTRGHLRKVSAVLWIIVAGLFLHSVLSVWDGHGFLTRLLHVDALTVTTTFTGGRVGGDAYYIQSKFMEVLAHCPLQGFGVGSIQLLDNGYLEFLYAGGLFSLALYFCVLAICAWEAIRGVLKGTNEGWLLTVLVCLIVGAGLGGPVLTLNRSSTVLWVIILLVLESHSRMRACRYAAA